MKYFILIILMFANIIYSQNNKLKKMIFGDNFWYPSTSLLDSLFIKPKLSNKHDITDYIYHNSILDIKFKSSLPKEDYQNILDNVKTEKWLNFSLSNRNVSFKYPESLTVKRFHTKNKEICDSIFIFEYFEEKDSFYTPIVTFYFTNNKFDEVAFNSGFDTTTALYTRFSDPPPNSKRKPIWVTYGRQQITIPADSIIGFPWFGLKGENFIGVDVGGMIGLGFKNQIILFYKSSDSCNIVFEFYNDAISNCDISEFEFIKMVEDFYKGYKTILK